MEEILIVKDLKKTFKLTAKQRKINKTNDLYKIAVDGLSFKAYKGEIYGLLDQMVQERQQLLELYQH